MEDSERQKKVAAVLNVVAGDTYKGASSVLREAIRELGSASYLDKDVAEKYRNSLDTINTHVRLVDDATTVVK